ncbi:hypothetical protein pb186bvf_009259 [Paramecium bursaria]
MHIFLSQRVADILFKKPSFNKLKQTGYKNIIFKNLKMHFFSCHDAKSLTYQVTVTNVITIEKQQQRQSFNINLETHIEWLFDKKCCGFKLKDYELYANDKDLEIFRRCLGNKIIFSNGVSRFYRTKAIIGQGSFSKVTLIEDFGGKKYALKSTPKCSDSQREIRILQQIDHDNIIRLIEVFQNDHYYFLVTDYVENTQIDHDHDDIKSVLEQLLTALKYLHSRGIVHKDIKTDNIIVDRSQKVKLIDFGFSNNLSDSSICGTPGYMAPEILRKEKYTTKADLFSVGVIMYQLYSRSKLFSASKVREILIKNKDFEIKNLSTIDIPDRGFDLLINLLQTTPNKRYSANQALQHPFFTCLQEPKIQPSPQMNPRLLTHLKYNLNTAPTKIFAQDEEI